MGNGASLFLSTDLSKNLSEKGIRTFQEFENECIARNLNAEQIYELLVNKYEELLDFDSQKKVETVKEHQTITCVCCDKPKPVEDTVNSTKTVPQKAKRPQPRVWGALNPQIKKKVDRRSQIYAHYSKFSLKAKPAKVRDANSSRSLSTNNKDESSLTRVDSLETLGDDDQTFGLTSVDTMNRELSSTTIDGNDGAALIPSEAFECKLCCKSFNSKVRLDRHIRFSEIHRQTLRALKVKFFDDANELNSLAKKAIDHFQESFKVSYSYLNNDDNNSDLNINRIRWKKAIGKVVSRFIARKYATFVSQLHPSQLHPQLIDDKIILIHTDHKFFWRSKSRFLFHFYLHEIYDCIEIIPQFLPSVSLQSNFSSNDDDVDIVDLTKISPRFYINRHVIQNILLQQKDHLINYDDGKVASMDIGPTDPPESITSQPSLSSINPETTTYPPETTTIAPLIITDLEICKFLLSKMKIDDQLFESLGKIEKAISFDSNHMVKNEQQPMGINTVIPYGLKAVDIEGLKLYDHWEIQMKLQEIQSSYEELNHAVNEADHFSRSIKLFSPSNY